MCFGGVNLFFNGLLLSGLDYLVSWFGCLFLIRGRSSENNLVAFRSILNNPFLKLLFSSVVNLIRIFPIFILIYLCLVLSSSAHNELKSGQSFDRKVDVQTDQYQKKHSKNQRNSKEDPICNNSGIVVVPILLSPEQSYRKTEQKHVGKC